MKIYGKYNNRGPIDSVKPFDLPDHCTTEPVVKQRLFIDSSGRK